MFPEEDEIVVGRAEIERYDEEEKELLRKVLNEIRQNPEKIPSDHNDRKKVKAATMKFNKVIALMRTESITETNIVLRAAGNVVAEMVGHKTMNPKENKTPLRRRGILEKQKALRKNLGQLSRMKRNELQNEGTKSKFEKKYRIEEKGIVVVHEEVHQRLVATGAKLERYDNRIEQCRQNCLFESNQKKLFDELDGVERETVESDAEESTRFWSNIWDKPVKHKDNPEWLRNVEEELTGLGVQDNIHIEVTKLKKQVRKKPNWKSPGPDRIQEHWINNLRDLNGNLVLQLDRCLQENNVPSWMVTGKTLLCVKGLEKRNAVANFRSIIVFTSIVEIAEANLSEKIV